MIQLMLSRTPTSLARKCRFMSTKTAPLVVSPSELMSNAEEPVFLLDTSWFMPNSPRNAAQEFISKRIKNAQYLDLDAVASDHPLGLKHMMPSPRLFADTCEKFGISPSSRVVCYDSHGVFSSPRALFMFRAFGHLNSSVLNGGLPLWELENNELESGPPSQTGKSHYPTPTLDESAITSYDEIVSNSTTNQELVLDARSAGRFSGVDPEPRPGLSSGHIPLSISLPFTSFLDNHTAPNGTAYTTLRSVVGIKKALHDAVGPERMAAILEGNMRVVASCGSGMTAGVLWLGLGQLGVLQTSLYDESWTGYAMRPSSVIVKGESL